MKDKPLTSKQERELAGKLTENVFLGDLPLLDELIDKPVERTGREALLDAAYKLYREARHADEEVPPGDAAQRSAPSEPGVAKSRRRLEEEQNENARKGGR